MIRIKATHEKHGLVIGTLDVITLPDDIVFVLNTDAVLTTDKQWIVIEQPTLSELMADAERQGLSDIEPLAKV